MRNDILFKAKAVEEGMGFLIGSIVVTDNNKNNPFPTAPIKKRYQDNALLRWRLGHGRMGTVRHRPRHYRQFTGLIDKNGNKVWESDIVRFDDSPYNVYATPYSGEVVFHQGYWCVKHKFYDHYAYPPLFRDDFADRKTEVLGNKFDNPELLTQND